MKHQCLIIPIIYRGRFHNTGNSGSNCKYLQVPKLIGQLWHLYR
jgi:hypothetical protein